MNEFLYVGLLPTRNEGVTPIFLSELDGKHDFDDVVFLIDSGPWLKAVLRRNGLRFRHYTRQLIRCRTSIQRDKAMDLPVQ